MDVYVSSDEESPTSTNVRSHLLPEKRTRPALADPLHSPEPDVREPEATALHEEMGEFLDEAGKSVDKLDLRSGFYTGPEESRPRHVVHEEDLQDHRMGHFPIHRPMSINLDESRHKKKPETRKPHSPQSKLDKVQEGDSDSESDGKGYEEEDVSDKEESSPSAAGTKEQTKKSLPLSMVPEEGYEDEDFDSEPNEQPGVSLPDIGETSTDPGSDKGTVDRTTAKEIPVGGDTYKIPEEDIKKLEGVAARKVGPPNQQGRRHSHCVPSLADRRRRGSEVAFVLPTIKEPSEQEEDGMLSAMHRNHMASHRLGENRGLRQRKMSAPASQIGNQVKLAALWPPLVKPEIDHTPHEVFVELAELHRHTNDEYEWRQMARWIKYEEDVEANFTRFGKPHVASLSFHSLLELRKVLTQGVVLMDLNGEDLVTIVNRVVDKMVIADQLSAENKGSVIKTLLLKHRRFNERGFLRRTSMAVFDPGLDQRRHSMAFNVLAQGNRRPSTTSNRLKRRRSTAFNFLRHDNRSLDQTAQKDNGQLGNKDDSVKGDSNPAPEVVVIPASPDIPKDHVKIDIDETSSIASNMSDQNMLAYADQSSILKRIPEGAEVTSVLVGSVDFLDQPIMAFVRLSKGCMLGNFTKVPLPVRFLFILMGPSSNTMDYHEIGRSISTLMTNKRFREMAYKAELHRDLLNAINEFLSEAVVLPPGKWDKDTLLPIIDRAKERQKQLAPKDTTPLLEKAKEEEGVGDALQRTGRPFGGMINDVRRRYPKYWSDIKDGLNPQCLATFFFIYFACLSPAITFGGLLGEKTSGMMGVSELLIMTSIAGILFALLSAQPLLIVGFTGPIIVFEEGLYQLCGSAGIDYLGFRVWICVWVWIIALLVVCFEGSFFVRYFTRFTMEIFAALISLIFIYEVFYKLYLVFQAHPLQSHDPIIITVSNLTDIVTTESIAASINVSVLDDNMTTTEVPDEEVTGQPNTALLSLILTLGTFSIAYFLRQFRNSQFLGRSGRRALGDFGIPIAILIMVVIDLLIKETYTQKLNVPDGAKPTRSDLRGWFINPLGQQKRLPIWAYFAAVLPGMLVFILIFMESQITGMIVSKKTKKGTGFHLDLMLIGSFSLLSGFMGLPLLTFATVRTVAHVSALSVMSRTHAPGEKPKLIEVKEQRLTGLAVHIMIGVSVLLGPVLRHIPLAVLFGVFLYMGVASMSGVQLFERVEIMFMPRKHHPNVGYVKKVRTSKMHLYTFLQLVCLAILWVVKSTKAALAFPFFLVLMIPVRRFLFPKIFLSKELFYLDKDDDNEGYDTDDDEPDFYTQAQMPV